MLSLYVFALSGVLVLISVPGCMSQAATTAPPDVCRNASVCYCWTITPGTIQYDCSKKQLRTIPSPYSDEAISITFTENEITTITRGPFLNLMNLQELQFIDNRVDTIEDGAFDRLVNLQKLFLNRNRLTVINARMFRHLPALEEIDISDNQITQIDKYSFFTAPSLRIIYLQGNVISCDCEERLFREFLSQNTISVKGGVCGNLGNAGFQSLPLSDFPACSSGESLFPPARSRYCYSCSSVSNVKECATKQQAQCIDNKAVCYNRIEYTNKLQVYGGCTDYQNCINWELQNKNNCVKDKSYVSCYFCFPNSLGNKFDAIGTTKQFVMVAKMTFDKDMTPGLTDPVSSEYAGFTGNLHVQVYNYIYGSNGSFAVEFVGLTQTANSKIVAEFRVTCDTIWFVSRLRVLRQLETVLTSKYIQGSQVTNVDVTLLDLTQTQCPSETTTTSDYGSITWPLTSAGAVSIVICPYQLDTGAKPKTASRNCVKLSDDSGRWASPVVRDCPKADATSRKLQGFAENIVTDNNVESISKETNTLTKEWQKLQATEVGWSVDIVAGIVDTGSSSTSVGVIDNTLDIINNLLFVDPKVLAQSQTDTKSSTRLVSNIDKFIDGIDVTSRDYARVTPNVAARVAATTAADFPGLSISFTASENQQLTDDKITYQQTEGAPPTGHSGIVVPRSVFTRLTNSQATKVTRLSSSVIREPKVFQTIEAPVEKEIVLENNVTVKVVRTINSNVIGTSVPGVTLRNLDEPVRIVFQHNRAAVSPECVYWEETGQTWKTDGCTANVTGEGYTVCHCNHLTNFALLMDVYGTGGGLSEADKLALAIISYIGCGVSLIAICLTLLTYLKFKKLRRDNPSKILMNLCLAIGLVDLVFVLGMQGYTPGSTAGCKMVAILLHYFLLAAIFWMAVEAFYMYLALVKVFDTYVARFQLKSSLFGWGIPLVIVVVTIGINKTDNYGVQPGSICWLDRIPFYVSFLAPVCLFSGLKCWLDRIPFYVSFLAPVCLILILNSISFVLVLRQISRRSSNKLTKTDRSSTAVRLRGAVSLIVLLGLTWLFGILAIDDASIVFHYLFAIFNSLQGFFIFIFYCCLKKEAQQCWRRTLPCLKSVYEQTTSSGTNKGVIKLEEQGPEAKRLIETQEDFSKEYGQTRNSESEVSIVEPSSKDSKTDSTDLARSSQASNSSNTNKETKFRGNWQISA